MPTDTHGHYFGSAYQSDETYRRSVGAGDIPKSTQAESYIAKTERAFAKEESLLAKAQADIANLETEFADMRAHRERERKAAEASAELRKSSRATYHS